MSDRFATNTTFEDWLAREAILFSLDIPQSFKVAVDKVMASLDKAVADNALALLGFGEALHGGEDILILRNRLFEYLVQRYNFRAIALESSFPRSYLANQYVSGHGPASYEAIKDNGFSHGFGQLAANRELIEWMRQYNATPDHATKLQIYGFDSPTEMMSSDSPRQLLHFVLDYLASVDYDRGQTYRLRIDPLLGPDAAWENPAAMMDPSQSIGLSPNATALWFETEELLTELRIHRPELLAKSGKDRYLEALHYASMARQLLTYHATLARASTDRTVRLLGMREVLMADNLEYIVKREQTRGKVLVFAHNQHLQRGKIQWQLGSENNIWSSVGTYLHEIFGSGYKVIGTAVGESPANGIGKPASGTLEARLTTVPGPLRFVPIHEGQNLLPSDVPVRNSSQKNSTYFPLTYQSLTGFDWLAVLDSTYYARGGPALPDIIPSPNR